MHTIEQLISAEEIRRRIGELGRTISADYRDRKPLLVGVLKGAFVFLADLCRELTVPVQVDFLAVSSYGNDTESTGQVRLVSDLSQPIKDRHIIIVEDIVDTGLTLDYLLVNLRSREPASIKVCALLDKPSRRRVEVPIDYLAFTVPDKFVVGYGLDAEQYHRNLPFIGVAKP